MTPERKKIVERLREEGRQAALAGKHRHTNPYKFMDALQWATGFSIGKAEIESARREDDPRAKARVVAAEIARKAVIGNELDIDEAERIIFEAYGEEI